MKNWGWIGLFLLATPVFAGDGDVLRNMMASIAEKNWQEAETQAHLAKDPIIGEIYDWYALRGGQGEFKDYVEFLDENGDWPGLPWLQERGENFLPAEASPDEVIRYIEHHGAQSDHGLYRYLQAIMKTGDVTKAQAVLMDEVLRVDISPEVMAQIEALGIEGYTTARFEWLQTQIYNREYEGIEANFDGLGEDQLAILNARLAVLRRTDLEPKLRHSSVLYDLMRVHKVDDRYSDAVAVMMEASSADSMDRPEIWADDRMDLARNMAWHGRTQEAYDLASKHHLKESDEDYPGLEFYAGFVALEFLKDNDKARLHFQRFKEVVNSPISNGRAGYWLGRAGDPTGYGYGAKWQTSFYGQLSAEMLGGLYDQSLLLPDQKADFLKRNFMQSDSIRAALYFYAAGEELLARRFMAHEAETLSPEDANSLGKLAFDLGMAHSAVHIGKNLANRGEVISQSYYPIPKFLPKYLQVPQALALSIMRQESEFYPLAESHVGARGLMQLMPATAEEVSNKLGIEYSLDGLKDDPEYNITLGTKYLRDLLRDFNGKLPVAVLSYNAGPGRGRSWQEQLGEFGQGDMNDAIRWLEMIPFDETRNYVHRVLEATFLYDAKLNGSYDGLAPSDLLLKNYPQDVDWQAVIEAERLEREKAEAEAAKLAQEAEESSAEDVPAQD